MPLPIGFFMPLPLPIMIPFMMWQSAAIAAGFGTYFQFAKRRVSAMSNEEFNKSDPHQLVNSMYEDIVKQIPSSFAKVDSLTPVMLQSMNVMLDQAVKWLQGAITGNLFNTPNPFTPNLPLDPTIDPSLELLDPSAQTMSDWSDIKIFHEYENNLDKYTPEAQSILTTLYNIRILKDRETDPEHEPRVPIPTSPVPSGFLSTLTKENYPDISQLVLTALQNAGSYAKALSIAASHWSNSNFRCKNDRNPELFCRRRDQWGKLIVAMNKAVSANLPFTL